MIENFHFIRPLWLLSLAPLLFLLPIWLRYQQQGSELGRVLAPHLIRFLSVDEYKGHRNPIWLAALCWLIASLAAAGPSWMQRQSPVFETERAQVILMDMNMATRATDIAPDRHTRLKFKAQDLIQGLTEGQTGLVAYAGEAFTIAPLTRDPRNINHMIAALSPEIMPIPGHDPVAGFREAHNLLQQAGYTHADIFWLTGSINRTQMEDIRSFLRPHNYRVSIIAAGTDEGAPVRTERGELLRTPQGALIIPRLTPSYFEHISRETRGHFTLIDPQDDDIQALLNLPPLSLELQEQQSMLNHDEWIDAGPYLAVLLLPLLLLFARRKNLLGLLLPCLLVTGMLNSERAYARDSQNSEPSPATRTSVPELLSNMFRNTNQRALNAYQRGHYDTARQLSEDSPMLKGMSAYRSQDYINAAEYFSALDTAEAHYNRGNSLAQAGELEQAIAAYEQALARQPDWSLAAENKALIEDMLEQQQQQSENADSEDGEPSDSESEPEQEQPQDSDTSTAPEEADDSDTQDQEQSAAEQQEQDSGHDSEPESDASAEQQQEGSIDLDALQEEWDHLTDEEREQLEQLYRRVPDDPAFLLRNRLRLEAQRRRGQRFN